MKARGTAVQGALALVALTAAYFTWQRPKDAVKAVGTVQVFDASKQSLTRVHFEDGTRFIELARKGGGDEGVWLTQGFLPGKTPPGTPLPDGGVTVVAATPTRELRGNERATTVFERFAPLEATRALGQLPDEKLNELGLLSVERTLEVATAGATHRFIASKPQPGVVGAYIKDLKTNDVYLLQGTTFTELDPASQALVERRLHTFKQPDFDAFVVTVDGKKAEFVQTDAQIQERATIARASSPERPDELVKNWHEKVFSRLLVTEVLGKGELPKTGEPKPMLRVDYSNRGAAKGWLEMAAADSTGNIWVRSENTAGWVGVHQGSNALLDEAKKVVTP